MNKVSDDYINTQILNIYNEIIEFYPKDRILGVFARGNVNYGFYELTDSFSATVIYLPTLEELCTSTAFYNEYFDENNLIHIVDIRELYSSALKQDAEFIEVVFTKYRIYNSEYEDLVHSLLLPHRETISHYNLFNRLANAYGIAWDRFQKKDYFSCARLCYAIQLYIQGETCEDCLLIKDEQIIDKLWKIKKDIDLSTIEEIKELITSTAVNVTSARGAVDKSADQILRNAVLELVRAGCRLNDNTIEGIKSLTEKELTVLKYIIDAIGSEGNISIQTGISSTGISRPVWKNTLLKIEKSNLALVKNQGVKGTNIHFFNLDKIKKFLEGEE